MGQLEKMCGRSKPGWFWLGLSTQNCEIEEKHIGVLCNSGPWMEQELWPMAECSGCCRLPPLWVPAPNWCLLGTADTPLAKVWKHLLWFFTFAVGVFVPAGSGTALGQGRKPCPCPLARQWTAGPLGSFPAAAEANSVKYSFSLVHTNISPMESRCAPSSASV